MILGRAVRGRGLVVLAVVLALACTGCSVISGSAGTVAVRTAGGSLQGVDDGATRSFLGIRYAEAPVGPRRWAPPVPAGPSARTATEPGPSCPQADLPPGARQDEDCLFLNVTTPADVRPGERLPVFVWWHGGGFVNGSGDQYGAQRLAEQGRLAVVTVNYRLGTLGYLGLPGLPGSGAFGFADQVQSLRWTRENIAAFGGDPDRMTVAGESAGGASTCALLGSPALTELAVKGVVVMSGACSTRFPANGLALRAPERGLYTPTAAAQSAGQAAATALGCPPPDSLACLRDVPVDALLGQSENFTALAWGGDLLPTDPATSLRDSPPSVSVIYGGTRDEARSFFRRVAHVNPRVFTPATYDRLLVTAFGRDAVRVRQQYPVAAFGNSAALAWSTVVTDAAWSCPARRDQQTLAAAGVPTYAYEFSRPEGPLAADGFPAGGAAHATELPLLFDRAGSSLPPSEDALARQVVGYWSSFARTGRPAAGWRAVPAGGPVLPLQLDPTSVRPVDTAAIHRCGFWSTVR